MSVGNEDLSTRRHQHIGRLIERIGAVPRHTGLAKREQHPPFRAELEHLLPLAVLSAAVGHPDVSLTVDGDAVRIDEHPGAEALAERARRVELQKRRDRRIEAGCAAAVLAAPLEHPDAAAVSIDVDGRSRTQRSSVWKLEEVFRDAVRVGQ